MHQGVYETSKNILSGHQKAEDGIHACFSKIKEDNHRLNCFTHTYEERALKKARDIDLRIAQGVKVGPLAGVPFSVKNLFDVQDERTLAGSKINQLLEPASKDAKLIQMLENADAILVGSVAMGEYAYDFTGENEHYGNCVNPWDTGRMAGGSSSGSGCSVASGLVPVSLGSDTNGSIRVPASLCGIFGLKPTYGRLSRAGTFPFCDSLDHVGPLARTVEDLALIYDQLQAYDPEDPASVKRSAEKTSDKLAEGIRGLRVARAGGYFDCENFPQASQALEQVAKALDVTETLPLEGAQYGRNAAYIITNAEGAALHKRHLQTQLDDFDKDTKDRFLAGCLIPAEWYIKAQKIRRWWLSQMLKVFEKTDLILAPATPCSAPLSGEKYLEVQGKKQLLRPNLGLFTQPFSAIGLPVISVPVWSSGFNLPIGVQIIAAPWREDLLLRAAAFLQSSRVCVTLSPGQNTMSTS